MVSPTRKRKSPSGCTTVPYQICSKKLNPECRWVYGSIRKQPTRVKRRHCRTRRNRPRSK